jgi:hypothetical protein
LPRPTAVAGTDFPFGRTLLFLTANTESIYTVAWINLKDGPVVIESPPNTLAW